MEKKKKIVLLNRHQASQRLGVTPGSLSAHVSRRNWKAVPKPVYIAGTYKWVESDLDNFILERIEESKTDHKQSALTKNKRRPGRPCKTRSAPCP